MGAASLHYSLRGAGAVERNARSLICVATASHQRQQNLRQTDKGPDDTTTTTNGGSRMIGASYQPIEDYGIIGDLHTVALVGMDGSIDFLCFPTSTRPTIFAALLDRRRGGRFSHRAAARRAPRRSSSTCPTPTCC